jgi:hypothetical protein
VLKRSPWSHCSLPSRGGGLAQEVVAPGYVTIPALGGAVDLQALPPEVRDIIRIPGVEYDDPEPEYRDLPPLRTVPERPEESGASGIEREPTQDDQAAAVSAAPELVFDAPLQVDQPPTHDANARTLLAPDPSSDGTAPEDAYRRAWEHIEQMPTAVPPAPLSDEPTSWLATPTRWLAALWNAMPTSALAQSAQWYPIGPFSFIEDNGTMFAGLINAITLDPQSANRIYLGTFLGGLWKTSSGGAPWTTTTDGVSGPTWCIQPNDPLSQCRSGQAACKSGTTCVISDPSLCSCTAATKSDLAVIELAMDDSQTPVRLWAATSRGLWYSDNAADPNTAPGQMRWYRVSSLPVSGSGEVRVNHILLSPWNKGSGRQVVYASIVNDPTRNGWYRSTDRGAHWTALTNGAIPANPQILRADISAVDYAPLVDTIYSIVDEIPTTCDGQPVATPRLFQLTASDAIHVWTLITANKTCTTSADCCDGGACQCTNGLCAPGPDCSGIRVVKMDPATADTVLLGTALLYKNTSGGSGGFKLVNTTGVHADVNALAFDSHSPGRVFSGTDSGIWRTDNILAASPVWQNLNNGLPNIEFYRSGTPDVLNNGATFGGTQDNGVLRGGNDSKWAHVRMGGGDAVVLNVDPKSSNLLYAADYFGKVIDKSADGGSTTSAGFTTGLPLPITQGPYDKLAMAPQSAAGPTGLVAYSQSMRQFYRNANADGSGTWSPISLQLPLGVGAFSIAVSHTNADTIFATSGGQILRTGNAGNATAWEQVGTGQLPTGALTSIAIDRSLPCTVASCTLYVTAPGFGTGHVFRSTNAGNTWTPIGGTGATSLPDLPVQKVVLHPTNPNVIYVAAEYGIYQGTLSGGIWTWGTFTSGLPKAAFVGDLTLHPESGTMRAYTFGRSAWETQLFSPSNPDVKVNGEPGPGENAQAEVLDGSVRASGNPSGSRFSVTWAENRLGLNNWHVYFRSFTAPTAGAPTPLGASDIRVDDTSTHVVQHPDVAAYSAASGTACSHFTWQDDRLNPGVNQHIYFQAACSDGSRLFVDDVGADTAASNVNATDPAIVNTFPGGFQDFVVAWQQDRSVGNALHDVYARFYSVWGFPKTCAGNPNGDPIKVNGSAGADARAPGMAIDGSNNVYVVWEEYNAATQVGSVLISKYTADGCTKIAGPTTVVSGAVRRREPRVAVTPSGSVIVAWWEESTPERVMKARLSGTLTVVDPAVQVDQPPQWPSGIQRALRAGVATQAATGPDDYAVTWWGTVNEVAGGTAGNVFARSFNVTGATAKNDYRVDLAPRGPVVREPVVTRGPIASGKWNAIYAWRDARLGHYDVYARSVPGLP